MATTTAFLSGPVKRIVLILVIAYVVLCVLAWLLQRGLLFLPDTSDPTIPSSEAAAGLVNVSLTTTDSVELQSWFWPRAEAKGIVVLFHGNAGNRGDRLAWMRRVHAMGWSVLVPDYRGYGGSAGSPSEDGLYLDGEAAWAYARAEGAERIVLAGSSVGSGVAVELAVRKDAAGLLLSSAPTSVARVGQDAYPFLPVMLLMRDRFDNIGKVARVGCPLLLLHGEDDEIVSFDHAQKLLAAAAEPKSLVPFADRGHNDLWYAEGDGYWAAIEAFLGGL